MAGRPVPPAETLSSTETRERTAIVEGRGESRRRLTVWERSLSSSSIDELEAASRALTPSHVTDAFSGVSGVLELVTLRTCQRVLVAAFTEGEGAPGELEGRWSAVGGWNRLTDRAAIHRLFLITAGLDSMAAGEREVRDQVRAASAAVLSRHPRPVLRNILAQAIEAAQRSETANPPAVADLAAGWLRARLPPDGTAPVTIVGSGRVGRRVAEQLRGSARITVVFHERPPAAEWVEREGLRIVPWGRARETIRGSIALVAAAKGAGRFLTRDDLPRGAGRGPRFLVDLGMPRNIDPSIGDRAERELVHLGTIPRTVAAVDWRRETERYAAADRAADEFDREAIEPWVQALRESAEGVRRTEFERALRHAGPLTPEAREAFERMSERVVDRLLAGATAELRSLPHGPEFDARRQRILERFRDRRGP